LSSVFKFKEFDVYQEGASLKVGTDAMVFGSFCKKQCAKFALDVGTGTGVLSLMVAQTHPDLLIDAVEIDPQNCRLAQLNFEKSKFSIRLNLVEQDIFLYSPTKKYDFIFSNPPFHIESLRSIQARNSSAKHFTDDEFEKFIEKIISLLSEYGKLFLILPSENLVFLQNVLTTHAVFINQLIHVYGKPNQKKRAIISCSRIRTELSEIDFLIRESDGNYSTEYIAQTKPFHGVELG
jgi:tRNA1Val (adenine37-N6)-methyltransferase